jgi:nucleotide-binding universal stress UspA family protein
VKKGMFKNILVPVSSEYYSKNVVQRSIQLAEIFKSNVTLIYIIEEKTISQTEKLTDQHITYYDQKETQHEILIKQKMTAEKIIFEFTHQLFRQKGLSFNHKTMYGEFSNVILSEIQNEEYDLILLGYEKECMLNYRLFDDTQIPVWTETEGKRNKTILAVCSNLAPNQKVPEISLNIASKLNENLQMIYIIDVEDSVKVDESGKRSDRKTKDELMELSQIFIDDMNQKGIHVLLIQGNLENEVLKISRRINPDLIIIGRGQKIKGKFGLPIRNIKRKILEKWDYNILFIN